MVGWNPCGFWSSDLGSVSIWLISGLFVMEWSTCTLLRNKRNWWRSRAKCNTYLWYWRSLEVLTGLLLSSFQQTNPAHRRHFYSKNMFQDSQWMTEIMNSTRPYTCCSFFHFYISMKKNQTPRWFNYNNYIKYKCLKNPQKTQRLLRLDFKKQ